MNNDFGAENTVIDSRNTKENLFGFFKHNARQYAMVIVLICICLINTILTNGIFISFRNLSNLFLQTSTVAVLAIGMVLVLVGGYIDLSVGSVAGFTGSIAAILMVNHNVEVIPSILITLIVGLLIGMWHGFWVAYCKVPAFIVTLAGYLIFRGAVIGVTNGTTIGPTLDAFKAIGQGYLPNIGAGDNGFNTTSAIFAAVVIALFIIMTFSKRRARIRYGYHVLPLSNQIIVTVLSSCVIAVLFSIMIFYSGISYAALIVLGLFVIFKFIAERTTFGRQIYAIGGNRDAAKLSGINIQKRTLTLFSIMGILSAVAGIICTARLNSANPASGTLYEMDAIAAAIIGGTSTMGGEGSIFGAIIGAFITSSIDNGMSLMNLGVTYQYVVKGLVLLLAVWLDVNTRKKSEL